VSNAPLDAVKTICLILIAVGLCAHAVELPSSARALSLARWIGEQQELKPEQSSFGAIKIEPGVAATSTDGTAYCRVSPYFANLAVLSLLRARTPGCLEVADRWIHWYCAHLNPQSAPDGVPDEHFYQGDGTGETTCVRPETKNLCHYNDATDSSAATFFCVLWADFEAGAPREALDTPKRREPLESLAVTLLKLQQSDGLCWAKRDYRVKYLEDNCEVFAGLCALANLESNVFKDANRSAFYEQAANRVQRGIIEGLYDKERELYYVAKFEDGQRSAADLKQWYPDTQAQLWPLLFDVVTPAAPEAPAVIAAVNSHWNGLASPDWAKSPDRVNHGWIEAGFAYAALKAGETNRVRSYLQAVNRTKLQPVARFAPPLTVADAGWLLQVLIALER
jgi:hypothetical protein